MCTVSQVTASQTKQATFHSGILLQTSASINKACCQVSDKKTQADDFIIKNRHALMGWTARCLSACESEGAGKCARCYYPSLCSVTFHQENVPPLPLFLFSPHLCVLSPPTALLLLFLSCQHASGFHQARCTGEPEHRVYQ